MTDDEGQMTGETYYYESIPLPGGARGGFWIEDRGRKTGDKQRE